MCIKTHEKSLHLLEIELLCFAQCCLSYGVRNAVVEALKGRKGSCDSHRFSRRWDANPWVFFMFGSFKRIVELLCESHCLSTHTQKIVPNQVSVYVWVCHEGRDCLYSRGNCCATACVFYHQCFPVYPPHGCQNKLSVLSDNTLIIFLWQHTKACISPQQQELFPSSFTSKPWGTKASVSSELDLNTWESHEQQE